MKITNFVKTIVKDVLQNIIDGAPGIVTTFGAICAFSKIESSQQKKKR